MSRHDVNFNLFFLISAVILTPLILYTSLFNVNITDSQRRKQDFSNEFQFLRVSNEIMAFFHVPKLDRPANELALVLKKRRDSIFFVVPVLHCHDKLDLNFANQLLSSRPLSREKGIPLSRRIADFDFVECCVFSFSHISFIAIFFSLFYALLAVASPTVQTIQTDRRFSHRKATFIIIYKMSHNCEPLHDFSLLTDIGFDKLFRRQFLPGIFQVVYHFISTFERTILAYNLNHRRCQEKL